MDGQWRFAVWCREARPGALWQPRVWDGWEVGGRWKREGTYVHLWLIHADVWQRPTWYCKAIILQLKINKIYFIKVRGDRTHIPHHRCSYFHYTARDCRCWNLVRLFVWERPQKKHAGGQNWLTLCEHLTKVLVILISSSALGYFGSYQYSEVLRRKRFSLGFSAYLSLPQTQKKEEEKKDNMAPLNWLV